MKCMNKLQKTFSMSKRFVHSTKYIENFRKDLKNSIKVCTQPKQTGNAITNTRI